MTTLWTIIAVFGVVATFLHHIVKYVTKNSKRQKLLDSLPGPPQWPLIGNLPLFVALKPIEFIGLMDKLANQFRHMGCFYLSLSTFGPRIVNLTTAETVSKLLQNWDHLEKGDGYEVIAEYMGDGLVTSKPEKWRHQRQIIHSAFTFKMLADGIRIFNEQSAIMVQLLHDKFDNVQDGGFHDLSNFLTRCSLDIILEAAFGTKLEVQTNEFSRLHHGIECLIRGINTRMTRPWYRPKWIFWNTLEGRRTAQPIKDTHVIIENIVCQKMKDRDDGIFYYSDGPKTFLDILLDSANPERSLNFKDIVEQGITIAGAGHDTIATAMNFVLFMMATHPTHQRNVQEELDSIFSKSKQLGYISAADLSNMKYLERCIKETLRLYPSVSGFLRILNSDLQLDNGLILPQGMNVLVVLPVLHKDPKVFPEPEEFDPNRFLPENCIGRHPCAFIPFSAGPRNCIGQKFALLEIKLLVASILREFNVETKDKVEDLKLIPSATIILVNPINMKLIPRIGG